MFKQSNLDKGLKIKIANIWTDEAMGNIMKWTIMRASDTVGPKTSSLYI